MSIKETKIFEVRGLDYNSVIDKYKELCRTGSVEISDDSFISVYGNSDIKYVETRKPRNPLKDNTKITNKIKYIVHSIAYRQLTSNESAENGVSMKMATMQAVIGKDVFELIPALVDCDYIERSNIYKAGKFSRHYKVKGEIVSEFSSNATLIKYVNKTKEYLQEEINKKLSSNKFINLYGQSFAETYIKNLNKFKITDKEGFEEYSIKCIKENPQTESYFDFIKSSFKNKLKIYSIDDNYRIYHILTSLKRELKKYLNIKFSIDCSNSHPLLFNYFIFLNKGLNIPISLKISSILSNTPKSSILSHNPKFHYDIKLLYNELKNNGIDISIFAEDELLYLWKTTNGCFWDDILSLHEDLGLSRAEVKQKMFAEVFYSHTTGINWKEFGKEFKKQYPNVYKLIEEWKNPTKNASAKAILKRRGKLREYNNADYLSFEAETALPNIMMELESTIFRQTLKTLFSKRIACVHIHDAIVVPRVKQTERVSPDQVKAVMDEVYKRFGLCPTLKVDCIF